MKQFVLSALALAACSHHATSTTTPPVGGDKAASTVPPAQIFAFKIGALDAVALVDGALALPNDGKMVGLGHDPKEVGALLAKAGLPTDHVTFDIHPLLVKDGAHTLLFDTGIGDPSHGGRLPESMKLAGVAPDAVTDIFISHMHGDHVGGLVANGKLAFPNATVHMTTVEWAAMQADDKSKPIATVIAPKVVAFDPGAQILPEVTAVDTHGHTPGHSSYDIVSNGEHLFYTGDVVHSSVLSIQKPGWGIQFDQDQAVGPETRKAVVAKLAADHTRVYAVHFPFPGLGHVTGTGDDLVWTPEK